jgi:hypothetical protein
MLAILLGAVTLMTGDLQRLATSAKEAIKSLVHPGPKPSPLPTPSPTPLPPGSILGTWERVETGEPSGPTGAQFAMEFRGDGTWLLGTSRGGRVVDPRFRGYFHYNPAVLPEEMPYRFHAHVILRSGRGTEAWVLFGMRREGGEPEQLKLEVVEVFPHRYESDEEEAADELRSSLRGTFKRVLVPAR